MNSYLDFRRDTSRLIIRPWRIDDAPEAFEMYGDPEVARYLTGVPEESLDTQRATLERIIAAYTKMDNGMGSFAAVRREDEKLVGCAMLKPLPRTEDLPAWRAFRDNAELMPPIHEIEVGWHLTRAAWGNGYATEFSESMVEYGFQELALPEIHAVLYSENKASWRVAERLGMRHLGSTDQFYGVEVEHFQLP